MFWVRSWWWRTALGGEMPSLILSECYSSHLLLWFGVWPWNPRFYSYFILSDRRDSCNRSEISLAIRLMYCDQLRFYFLHKKIFWLLLLRYGRVRTCKAYVPELGTITRSSVKLLNHTKSEAMHNLSAHRLARYYQPQWVSSTAWTASVKWYTRHQLARTKIFQNFWLNLIIYIYIYIYIYVYQ